MVDSIFGKQEVVDSGRIRSPPPAAVKPVSAVSNGENKVNGHTNGYMNDHTMKQEVNSSIKSFNKTAKDLDTVTKRESKSGQL